MNRTVASLLMLLLASCATGLRETKVWRDSTAAAGANAGQLAQLDWSRLTGLVTVIDGNKVADGCGRAVLTPGSHAFEYAYYTAGFGTHPSGTIELTLEAGHEYELRIKLCFWCSPRKFAVWVDDKTTGHLVWGQHPDWPAWWL